MCIDILLRFRKKPTGWLFGFDQRLVVPRRSANWALEVQLTKSAHQ